MAEMVQGESEALTDPVMAISQGKRHLLVRDYAQAVSVLARACELLASEHGDLADQLGEPYLLYGRALLYLARDESDALGTGVPGNEDQADQEQTVEDDEEDDEEDEGEGEGEEHNEEGAKDKDVQQKKNKTDEDKLREKEESEKQRQPVVAADEGKPGTSKSDEEGKQAVNGQQQGAVKNTEEPEEEGEGEQGSSEDANKEDEEEEEEVQNLQVAWEVLELAKRMLLKRGQAGWKQLAEAHKLLGEVAMEAGNHEGALTDLNACLDLLKRLEPAEPRSIAETHYQLGVAFSLANEFDKSIEQFAAASKLLEERIKELEASVADTPQEPSSEQNPFYSVDGEIKELKSLLPEIKEKIIDMNDFKEEACKAVLEGIKSKVGAGGCSNGSAASMTAAGPSGESSSTFSGTASSAVVSPPKPASDISHLVRKKRKIEEPNDEDPKKACL